MAEAAKQERATAKGALTRTRKRVITGMENKLSQEILKSRFETATSHWNMVIEMNEKYLQLMYTNGNIPAEEEECCNC